MPAKPLRARFDPELIEMLLTFDYAAMNEKFIRDHIDSLYAPLSPNALAELLNDATAVAFGQDVVPLTNPNDETK